MEENIKILEGYLDRNTQLFEDYGENAIIQDKEIQALENLIKGYRKLEEKYKEELDDGLKMSEWLVLKQKQIEELEYKYDKAISDLSIDAHRLNEAEYIIKLTDENYRSLVDVIQKDCVQKSRIKEKIEELEDIKLCSDKYFQVITENKIKLLQELMEDK